MLAYVLVVNVDLDLHQSAVNVLDSLASGTPSSTLGTVRLASLVHWCHDHAEWLDRCGNDFGDDGTLDGMGVVLFEGDLFGTLVSDERHLDLDCLSGVTRSSSSELPSTSHWLVHAWCDGPGRIFSRVFGMTIQANLINRTILNFMEKWDGKIEIGVKLYGHCE